MNYKDVGEFVTFSILERCRFKLRVEGSNSLFGFVPSTMSYVENDAVYELSHCVGSFDLGGPRVYIKYDGDFIRVSMGDSLKGVLGFLVFPEIKVKRWEEVLFEGYISDPEFDLDLIVRRINWKFFRYLIFSKFVTLLFVPFFGCIVLAWYFGFLGNVPACLGAVGCCVVSFVVLLVCLKVRI